MREFLVELRPDRSIVPLADSSIARTLVAVRGLHRFAVAEGWTDVDVAHEVSPPRAPRRLPPKSLPIDHVARIPTPSAPTTPARVSRPRALLELLYSCGARISEAIGLDVDDLDIGARAVRLRGKGGRERIVPIGGPAADALDGYLVRGRPAPAAGARSVSVGPGVFLNARGGRLSRQSAWRVLASAAERAGIAETVSPHLAAQFCHPSARRWCRCPGGAGVARPCVGHHHTGVYARDGQHDA